MAVWEQLTEKVDLIDPISVQGLVKKIVGLMIESAGPRVSVGEYCHVLTRSGRSIPAEVVGFRGTTTMLDALDPTGA